VMARLLAVSATNFWTSSATAVRNPRWKQARYRQASIFEALNRATLVALRTATP
jgi:hypothetical protein